MKRITRYLNRFLAMAIAICLIITALGPIAALAEDISGHWAAHDIGFLREKGIVRGDDQGNINPDANITRAEFVAIINRAFNFTEKGESNFPDVKSGAWYYYDFAVALSEGYVKGDNNGNANPDMPITRAEVAVIFARVLKLEPGSDTSTFADSDTFPDWGADSIIAMTEKELIKGYPDNTYRAQNSITRAEAFTILARIIMQEAIPEGEDEIADAETPQAELEDEKDGNKPSGSGGSAQINIKKVWLDEDSVEIDGNAPSEVAFTNGYKLGGNSVAAGTQVAFEEYQVAGYEVIDITVNGESVDEVEFTASRSAVYNIVFTNQAVGADRKPSNELIDLWKLYRLISGGYVEAMLYDDMTIMAIDGKFTTVEVYDEEDALSVFYQLHPLLGLDVEDLPVGSGNFFDIYDITVSTAGEGPTTYYHLTPKVNDVSVVGGSIVLAVNSDGVPTGLFSTYISSINAVNTQETVSKTEAEETTISSVMQSVLADVDIPSSAFRNYYAVDSLLVIDNTDREANPILAWLVTIHNQIPSEDSDEDENGDEDEDGAPFVDMSCYIYANGSEAGEIYLEWENLKNAWTNTTAAARDLQNQLRTINIQTETPSNGPQVWRLRDDSRNIETYNTAFTFSAILGTGRFTLPGDLIEQALGRDVWLKNEVSAHYNMSVAYNFYLGLGRRSYDDKGAIIKSSINFEAIQGVRYDNAAWVPASKQLIFGADYEGALDVVGHELTHAVIGSGKGLDGNNVESAALEEALCDIMGSLIEGKNKYSSGRWQLGEDAIFVRTMSNKVTYASLVNAADEEHNNCAIVNYAAYKMITDMRTSGISDATWAKVFYAAIHPLPQNASFRIFRCAVLYESRNNGFTADQRQAIKDAFDDAGITGSDVARAKDTFSWTRYEHPNYEFKYIDPQPANRASSFQWFGKDVRMLGYNQEAYKDFLFNPGASDGLKIFSFDIERDKTDWHSIEGGGFLFNTSISGGTIEGYCILTTAYGLKLVRISLVSLSAFRDGTYEMVQDAGSLLRSVSVGDPYAKQSYEIFVSKTEISVWCNGVQYIDKYQLPTQSTSFGFGPITSHASHACSQLSYYTFSNIRMETTGPR